MINKYFFNRIRQKLDFLVGGSYELDLETRIFHTFSLIAIVAAFLTFILNSYLGLSQLVLISLSIFLLQSLLYYLSRFKGKQKLAITISGWEIHILLALNYFLNQGIKGPTLLLYTATLFFITVISYRNWLIYVFLGNALLIGVLILSEYLDPDLLLTDYPNREAFFIDTYFTYLITISLIYTGISYLLRSYIRQRKMLIEKAEALRKTNEEKDKLFSIISHDLRTPLANVHQYLEMMGTLNMDREEKKNIENKLLDITRNTQELLTNLLYWSKNQMESPHINLRPIHLTKEVLLTIEHLRLIATRKGITLHHHFKESMVILADQDMLNLIIRNILYNAVKFTPVAGKISFTARQQDDCCLISIQDNGQGIPAEKQNQLFDFNTESSLGTNNEKGTGIGLMLCWEYMQLQNGKIWFESEESYGTTFYLSFPIAREIVHEN